MAVACVVLLDTDALAAPITVAQFDFDDEFGGPDAEGWRALEREGDEDAYFHVEDFSGAGHTISPLSGSASMWCGLTAEDPRTCHWEGAPGYGNSWRQNLSSVEFAVQGDVTLAFLMDASLETGYDFVFVQYEDLDGAWITLDSYDCGRFSPCNTPSQSYVIPAAEHDGTIRFRFFLSSDGAISDEGFWAAFIHTAFVVDDLSVSDATGLVDFQDFESEAINDAVTTDGNWYAEVNSDALNSGGLHSGTSLLQESVTQNSTNMWAFLGGSTTKYTCVGHPEQATTPWTRSIVRSPRISIMQDVDGNLLSGVVDSIVVSFDVYRDIPVGQQKSYITQILSYSPCFIGRQRSWHDGNQKDWFRHEVVLVPPAGTIEIVVELGVDNTTPDHPCNSHAPLFDNVVVERFGGVVTATQPADGPLRGALSQNRPNPFNPITVIEYEVPAGNEHVQLRIFDARGRIVRTLVDERQRGGPASVSWDGTDQDGRQLASGVYYYQLTTGNKQVSRRMVLLK